MTIMTTVTGHFFWYADERPDTFAQQLFRVLCGSNSVNWSVADQTGIKRFRTATAKPFKQTDLLALAWRNGFIAMRALAKLEGGKVGVLYEPSVLSAQYDPFAGKSVFPSGATQSERSMYRSWHSGFNRVKHLNSTLDPHLLLFEISKITEQLESKEQTRNLADAVLDIETSESFRWLAVFDASPDLLLDIVAYGLRAGAVPLTDRLDKYMGAPSYLTMGSKATILQYRDSIVANFPEEKFDFREQGNSAYLLFKDMTSVKRVFMPIWHELTR